MRGQAGRTAAPEKSPITMGERRGSSVAHGSALLIGVPLTLLLLPVPLSLVPCPVVSYMIARSFRRRKLAWGAFQGLQASAVQALIVLLTTLSTMAPLPQRLALGIGTAGFLLFLYSLWGALDTLLGVDFRYHGISGILDRVSRANLQRPERSRRWLGGKPDDRNGKSRG